MQLDEACKIACIKHSLIFYSVLQEVIDVWTLQGL